MEKIDIEREYIMDKIFLIEREKEIEQQYSEQELRLPARISVIIEKKKEENYEHKLHNI